MTELDLTLESIVHILRSISGHALTPDLLERKDIQGLYERWSRHLLFLEHAPGKEEEPQRPTQRDWFAVRSFVEAQQTRQQQQVETALHDLRASLVVCAETMNSLLEQERSQDALAEAQLESLLGSVENGSPEEIRAAVVNTVTTVRLLLEERDARLHAQLQFLTQQVKLLAKEVEQHDRPPEQDPVTRLETRRSFDDKLSRSTALKKLTRDEFCVILVELDDFAQLRDAVGDTTAEALLRRVSRCLAQTFPRRADTLARYEAHEFAVLLRDANAEDGRKLSERLQEDIRRVVIEVEGRPLHLTASVGVAELKDDENSHRALARADMARYKARLQGGNCVMMG
ncbi:MAG: GGDEF domain-containing protein [Myxococcota bacterium]